MRRAGSSRLLARDFQHYNQFVAEAAVALRTTIANMERYQQPNFGSKKSTERDHLKEYIENLDKRIALILPHTQIKVLENK